MLYERFRALSISHSILSLIPYDLAVEYFVIPHGIDDKGRLQVISAYPHDAQILQCIQMHTGRPVRATGIEKELLLKLIAHHYGLNGQKTAAAEEKTRDKVTAERLSFDKAGSTITAVNDIVHEAIRLRASDIHLEPFEREMRVRFRIDGVLQEMTTVPLERVREVASRIKIMASMDIAEKRRSQDGRIRITENGKDVDVRVSTLPTDFGEKIVLRLLDKASFDYNLDTIGLEPSRLALFKKCIQMPNGIVLITGPTGSGKTTTLYGVMNFLKRPGINISTVEDPIEYNIPGVNQTQVNALTGMTFAYSLRTLLRQDPDIIMVGEMRDQETADIAIRSSLTGHLVLSTLHTNDAPSAVSRMMDMGVESYLVGSSLTMIVAQRLVRRICDHCRCEEIVSDDIRKSIGILPEVRLYKGLGCSQCGHTGYKGRTGIFEVLPISDEIRRLVNKKAFTSDIKDQALKEGMITLRQSALANLTHGLTSLEEVLREISVL